MRKAGYHHDFFAASDSFERYFLRFRSCIQRSSAGASFRIGWGERTRLDGLTKTEAHRQSGGVGSASPQERTEALSGKELGPIDSECLHTDEHFPALRYGNRSLLDLKNIGRPRLVNDDSFHDWANEFFRGLATDLPLG